VGEKILRECKMSDAAYVDQAANWAKRLTLGEARGPGDMENAWQRLEARYGVPWRVFWALRYRKPSSVTAYIYQQLRNAYEAEREAQLRRIEHEKKIEAKTGLGKALVGAALYLAGEEVGGD
jgi:hypothetical protein